MPLRRRIPVLGEGGIAERKGGIRIDLRGSRSKVQSIRDSQWKASIWTKASSWQDSWKMGAWRTHAGSGTGEGPVASRYEQNSRENRRLTEHSQARFAEDVEGFEIPTFVMMLLQWSI